MDGVLIPLQWERDKLLIKIWRLTPNYGEIVEQKWEIMNKDSQGIGQWPTKSANEKEFETSHPCFHHFFINFEATDEKRDENMSLTSK